MPALVVIDAGASCFQGLGRYGAQRYGIAPGGAMDRMALAEANALIGQSAGAAAIEIGLLPMRLRVEDGSVRIAFSGADRQVYCDDRLVPLGITHVARSGEIISIRGTCGGQYSYLSVQGGFHGRDGSTDPLTGSSSDPASPRTWVLRNGDRISLKSATAGQPENRLRLLRRGSTPIRVVLGPQLDYFSQDALQSFLATRWSVSHATNRMAYRLEGNSVATEKGFNIISDGTVTGNIQITGTGQPLVILRDRGTIGGYPKIATIISADIGRFAQTPALGHVTFESISVVEAQVRARDFAFELANVKPKVEIIAPNHASLYALLDSNVAGDAFNPFDSPAGLPYDDDISTSPL